MNTFKITQWTHYWRLMRFDKPIGILLLLWPTLWALWLAAKGMPNIYVLFIFILGVVLMRAAGCVINDFTDRDIDGHVKRTCLRPLAAKKVTTKEALLLFVILSVIAFLLVLTLNILTIELAILGFLLASIYPLTKRITHLPQVVLGLAFSWGIPMAFAAVNNHVPLIGWLLFAANMLWTVAYDTQYAMVDREDDLKIGIKSTAILFGHFDRLIIGVLQFLVLLLLIGVGYLQRLGMIYYFGLLLATMFFIYQQYLIYDQNPKKCFKAFLNNNWFGLFVFMGIFLAI